MLVSPLSASMRFSEAAETFLDSRAPLNSRRRVQYVSERTLYDTGAYLKTLNKFFRDLRLQDIHAGHLKSYQAARANGDPAFLHTRGRELVSVCVGAAKINDELAILKRVMIAAGAWTPLLDAQYCELEEPDSEIPRALSPEEQHLWLCTAERVNEWRLMWWYSLVALHTTFSTDEMRTIRQGDINLSYGLLAVNHRYGKNRYRRREIPLTDPDCLWALERLLDRAWKLGGKGPALHLFPVREARGHYDGTQPLSESGFRKPFLAVRDASGLGWFRLNGMRHTAITRMAEAGVPIAVIQQRAGHISLKMTAHYTHISEQVQRQAMMQVPVRKPMGRALPKPTVAVRSAVPDASLGARFSSTRGMQNWTGFRAFA